MYLRCDSDSEGNVRDENQKRFFKTEIRELYRDLIMLIVNMLIVVNKNIFKPRVDRSVCKSGLVYTSINCAIKVIENISGKILSYSKKKFVIFEFISVLCSFAKILLKVYCQLY